MSAPGRRRIALAGLGAAARGIHLPAYRGLPGLEVVGGCDPAARPGAFPFPLYGSPQELIERARPDLLAVVAPPDAHFELARLGLLAGCHVLCEKPLTETLEQAQELLALSRRAGRFVVVNNQYRFMRMHAEAKRFVGHPEFGRLLFLEAQQSFFAPEPQAPGWRAQGRERTCKEFGTHVFDLCRFFFDAEPVAVTACMPRPLDRQGPDLLDLVRLDFADGRAAQVTLDRLCRGPHRYLNLRLDGSAGFIETRLGGGIELRAGLRGHTRRPYFELDWSWGGRARLYHAERSRKIASDPLDVFAAATRRLMQAFLDALDAGTTPPCAAEDNQRTLALMRAAYDSAERGTTVALPRTA